MAENNHKREIFGWTMYDWANSAFSTTVVTTFLGPYLDSLAQAQGGIQLFGLTIEGGSFFSYCVSISVILQVFFLPILGAISDFTHLKKRLMMTFAYIGAGATILLFFVTANTILLGGLLFIIANLSFGAAIVFYNAFLPEIASPDERDAVSSRGFGLGYLGGGLLLVLNLVVVLFVLADDAGLAVRLSLASAGVWWFVFTYFFTQPRLVQRAARRALPSGENYLSVALKQLRHTLHDMRHKYPNTLRYLIAYLVYNDGVQTVIAVSTIFAARELGADSQTLIILVLLIQFVAFGGAFGFGYLAGRIGAKNAILISLVIWSGLVIYAYGFLFELYQLWILGAVLALVLGGSQALSRSLFSQMIPADQEAEYFGFYEISERGTAWIGPLAFGLVLDITGSSRLAVLMLIFFFVVGLILLYTTDVKRAIVEAGNELPRVV